MMRVDGIVQAVADGRAQVRLQPAPGCASCGTKSACGGSRPRVVWMDAPAGVKVGDAVSIDLPAGSLSGAALVGYLLPAVTTLAGAALLAAAGDLAAVAGAGAGLGLGLVAVRRLGRRLAGPEMHSACKTDFPTIPGGVA